MNIEIKRVDDAFHFTGTGSACVAVHIDSAAASGGTNSGARPMELVLMALGSCSAFDVVSILKKQRQDLKDISISVNGERREKIPAVFESINMVFHLTGNLDEDKVKRAVSLSVEKYCSVYEMLNKSVKIDYSWIIHNHD